MEERVKMRQLLDIKAKSAGLSPGTPVYIGERRAAAVRIEGLRYDEQNHRHERNLDPAAALELCRGEGVKWLNVFGVHEVGLIDQIGQGLDIHPLVLEDVAHTTQRPKFEDYDGQIYVVAKMIGYDEGAGGILGEQVSFILGDGWLVTFQEREGDVFEPVRQRLRAGSTRLRRRGPDYLLYALLDAIVDGYFGVLEKLGDRIEQLEDEVMDNPKPESLHTVHALRKQMIYLRKSIWPLREAISALEHSDSGLVADGTKLFLRDVYDHTVQLIDTVETFRDMVGGLYEMYMSSVGNRMNEVMKVLTIIATIFIPITFVAGVYGMNFEVMPELDFPWAYPATLGVMVAMALGMLWYFRRQRWL